MIKNVVFDMGRVLIHWQPDHFMDKKGVPDHLREDIRREVFDTVEWVQLDRGVITDDEAIEIMRGRLPQEAHSYVRPLVSAWWTDCLEPMEGIAELLEELKGLGYRLYVLSNATPRVYEYFDRIPGSQYFDGRIFSADWKEMKPEREIYQTLLRQFDLKPEECFFIDDVAVNVEGARLAGIHGTIFRADAARLRRDLRAAGVPVREG